MVDDAFGLAMKDGADLEVAFEFAKGFFDFEEVFVVALDLRGIGAGDAEFAAFAVFAPAAARIPTPSSRSAAAPRRESALRFFG